MKEVCILRRGSVAVCWNTSFSTITIQVPGSHKSVKVYPVETNRSSNIDACSPMPAVLPTRRLDEGGAYVVRRVGYELLPKIHPVVPQPSVCGQVIVLFTPVSEITKLIV